MNNTAPIAIIRKTFTVAITFVGKPSEERRKALKDAGYKFESGQWYKSDVDGQHADEAKVAQLIAA